MSETIDRVYTIHEDELRTVWALATIYEVVGEKGIFVDGDWVESKDQDPNGDVRLIQLADIGDGEYRNKSARFLTYEKALELGCTFLQKGDILIARMPDPLGRACIFPGDEKKAVTAVDVAIVRPGDNKFNNRWLMHFVNAPAFRAAVASMQSGSTRKRISRKNLARIVLPVPPRKQQDQIVDEVEKQFSRLDEAVASLKRAKVNLMRYKTAVLKAAVEGKLTEQWRKEHPDVEPACKLLERILTERRKKWEETELTKIKAEGRDPKREKWRARYKEPIGPGTESLPDIPNTWAWSTLPQLGELNRGKSKHRPRNEPKLYGGPYPFIQTGDIRHSNGVITKYTQTYSEVGLKQSRLWPKRTLCITIAANIADTAILGFNACFPDSVVGFIPESEYTDVRFTEYFFRTAKKNIEKFAPATAQKNINLDILGKVAIPLPPEREQKAIIEEIERRLSVAEEIERSIETNMTRAEHFRRSILKKAFSGKLVLQSNEKPETQRMTNDLV